MTLVVAAFDLFRSEFRLSQRPTQADQFTRAVLETKAPTHLREVEVQSKFLLLLRWRIAARPKWLLANNIRETKGGNVSYRGRLGGAAGITHSTPGALLLMQEINLSLSPSFVWLQGELIGSSRQPTLWAPLFHRSEPFRLSHSLMIQSFLISLTKIVVRSWPALKRIPQIFFLLCDWTVAFFFQSARYSSLHPKLYLVFFVVVTYCHRPFLCAYTGCCVRVRSSIPLGRQFQQQMEKVKKENLPFLFRKFVRKDDWSTLASVFLFDNGFL